MGQKIHPIGFRLSVNKNWSSRWYANSKNFATMLNEDLKVRAYLKKRLSHASVGKVIIERPAKDARITIHSARPGVVIGKKGEDIEILKADLRKLLGVQMVHVNIEEIRKPEVDAQLIADSIAQQLEKRIMFRRAMKRAMQNAMRLGAQGVKIMSAGRLNGIEIARTEWCREGRVPLHTLRADIDYGFSEAKTTYGVIGVKCWVYKGEVMAKGDQPAAAPAPAADEVAPAKKVKKLAPRACRPEARARTRGRRCRRREAQGCAASGTDCEEGRRRRQGQTRAKGRIQDRYQGQDCGEEIPQAQDLVDEERIHASTGKNQVPQAAEGTQPRRRDARQQSVLRRLRPQGDHPRTPHRAPDRGRAAGDDAPHQARRAHLHPHLSRQARLAETGRGAHGQRQGQPGVLRRRDPARQGALRNGRRGRADGARGLRSRRGQAAVAHDFRFPADGWLG